MVDKVLCLMLTVAFFKDVSGNSAATTSSSKVCGDKCCAGYRTNSNSDCEVCPHGTFGADCKQTCPIGYFGELCTSECNCKGEEVCVPATGCLCSNCTKTDTDLDETKAKGKISVQFLYTTLVIGALCFILLVIGAGYLFKFATKRCQCSRTPEEQAITIGQAYEERQEGADINFSTGPYDSPLESNSINFTIDIDSNTPPNAGCYLTPVTKNDPYVNMESPESSHGNPYQNY